MCSLMQKKHVLTAVGPLHGVKVQPRAANMLQTETQNGCQAGCLTQTEGWCVSLQLPLLPGSMTTHDKDISLHSNVNHSHPLNVYIKSRRGFKGWQIKEDRLLDLEIVG